MVERVAWRLDNGIVLDATLELCCFAYKRMPEEGFDDTYSDDLTVATPREHMPEDMPMTPR